ncbi:lysylphosphatidylglycerol synthase transmembrane domain-containing protein [Aestuariibius sp. 2305UL40-4]|uniref:lysylphosphatidylglycerol synthase transmembrane domain-containing protein n=1 Tax=Aestuariibius violaceus TaxID=3234132 RepID=UPI00345E5B95
MTAPSPAPNRRWRDLALIGGLLVLVLAGLAGLAIATGWEETRAELAKFGWAQVGILLVLSLVNYGMRAVRWHLFTRRLDLPTHLGQSIRHFFGGFAMSVTPGRVGELIRLRWLSRETGASLDRTAPLVLVDRAADLAAMGLALGLTLALGAGGIAYATPVAALAVALAVIVTRPALLSRIVTLTFRLTGRAPRLMSRARRAALSLGLFTEPKLLTAVGLLSLFGWLAEGYAFHLLLVWFGAELDMATAIAIFLFATLAGGLTGAPGGLGGAEIAMVALLTLKGISPEVAIAATSIIRLTTLWFAIAIGLAVFPIAERKAAKAL